MNDRLSISSSESGLYAYYKALVSPTALLCLMLLAVLEVLTRLTIPPDKISKGGFPNGEVRQQVIAYGQEEKVDMLIVGSSIAAVNFPPRAIDEELSRDFPSFVSFNGGIRGCNMTCITRGTEQLYLAANPPRHLLIAISPEDLDTANRTVQERSHKFVEQLDRSSLSWWVNTLISDAIYLFGFQEHIRAYLQSRKWDFDSAEVLTRGHVDMGSVARQRRGNSPVVETDSALSGMLRAFVTKVTEMGIEVILFPTEGDSEARMSFNGSSREAYSQLLSLLAKSPGVTLVNTSYGVASPLHQADSSFIDNLHLNSNMSSVHGRAVGAQLSKLQIF